jgi:hypothetical protein
MAWGGPLLFYEIAAREPLRAATPFGAFVAAAFFFFPPVTPN